LTSAAKNAPGPKARAMASKLLKVEKHLWTFLTDLAIPVTNHLREVSGSRRPPALAPSATSTV
jgi:hypothetical protein